MAIVLFRVDDRLIHGQVVVGWGRPLGINRVVRNSELRARFGANGRRRVEEQFSWDAIAQKTVELYRSLVR